MRLKFLGAFILSARLLCGIARAEAAEYSPRTTLSLDGAWQIALLSNGRYAIQRNGAVLIRGRDTETTTTISFGHETGPAACTGALGPATYRWSLRAGLLRLTTVREGCLGRHVVLTTHPLKKVG